MPIYAYKCSACGHTQDMLQRLSDAPLTTCPACGAASFSKQVTAAGFQLKGAGWYVTDFRAGGDGANSGVGKEKAAASADGGSAPANSATPSATPSAAAAAPSPAPQAVAPAPVSKPSSTAPTT